MKVYNVVILVGLFFQCAVMAIVEVSLSSSIMWGFSSSVISPFMGPIHLVLVRRVPFTSSGGDCILLHVSGHQGRVMCLFFQSIVGLCCRNHVRPIIALSLPMSVIVNRICSSPIVSFSKV